MDKSIQVTMSESNAASNDELKRDDILQPGINIRPVINNAKVTEILKRLYGIQPDSIEELKSYDDRNYLVKQGSAMYILKILNALDSRKFDIVEAQNEIMIYLFKHGIKCPKPVPNVQNKFLMLEYLTDANFVVRLFEYIPGEILYQVEVTDNLLYQCGNSIAQIDVVLERIHNPALKNRKTIWMLQSVPELRQFLHVIENDDRKNLLIEIIESFEKILEKQDDFEIQIIHGDYNEQNIIVNKDKNDQYYVDGIIDFGDVTYSPVIFEIGIALTYMILQTQRLESGKRFLSGYKSVRNIKENELKNLKYCVAARIAQSLILGAYTNSMDQSNEYVLVTQANGWKMITSLWRNRFNDVDHLWGL